MKIKILMGINKDRDENLLRDEDQVYFNLNFLLGTVTQVSSLCGQRQPL